jgi:nitroimidazol reductase NimA-like FMN-containing flavoprotein (pyridoxamine 5'-phosphate oxidase superfamily)
MTKTKYSFEFVEQKIRQKSFAVFSTVDEKGIPHSTGILYAVSPPQAEFLLYILTEKKYKKVHNLEKSPFVSMVIPFPHHLLHFIPSSCIQFQGVAEILPYTDTEALNAFKHGKRILRMNLEQPDRLEIASQNLVFIKVNPRKKIFCYGVGVGLLTLMKDIEKGVYSVNVPGKSEKKLS